MFPNGTVDTDLIRNFLIQAETLGFDSAWAQDQIIDRNAPLHLNQAGSDPRGTLDLRDLSVSPMPLVDPLTLIGFVSSFTSKIKLGTSVIVSTLRSPVHLAKIGASLDQLTDGRLILGVGLGGISNVYPVFGLNSKGRRTRFEEGINLLKRLWIERQVSYKSPFFHLNKVTVEPKPHQKPHPPIFIGAREKPALRRAVKLGDGWLGGGSSSTKRFKWELDQVNKYLEQENKCPKTFHISKRVYIAVDRNKKRASENLQKWFYQYYRNATLALETAIFGNEQECIEKISELPLDKLDMILLNPVYDLIEQPQLLAENILPNLG